MQYLVENVNISVILQYDWRKSMLSVIDRLTEESDKVLVTHIYTEYMPMIRSRVRKHVADSSIREDIAHDCIVDVIRYVDSVRKVPDDKLRAYVATCIENRIKHYLKKSSKECTGKKSDVGEGFLLADGADVADEIEQKYDYQSIRAAFDKLKESDKSIIAMKYDLELDDEHIANVLCIDKNSVRMTVLRSVRKMKNIITDTQGCE